MDGDGAKGPAGRDTLLTEKCNLRRGCPINLNLCLLGCANPASASRFTQPVANLFGNPRTRAQIAPLRPPTDRPTNVTGMMREEESKGGAEDEWGRNFKCLKNVGGKMESFPLTPCITKL